MNVKQYMNEINKLQFSHFCGGITINNTKLEAYSLDEETYRIFRYIQTAQGDIDKACGIESLDIKKSEYEDLAHDFYNISVRVLAVEELFEEKQP